MVIHARVLVLVIQVYGVNTSHSYNINYLLKINRDEGCTPVASAEPTEAYLNHVLSHGYV